MEKKQGPTLSIAIILPLLLRKQTVAPSSSSKNNWGGTGPLEVI